MARDGTDESGIIGIDIGYSNLKVAVGQRGGEPTCVLRPAGAAPADRMPEKIGGGDDDAVRVVIGDRHFVAGISPDRAEMWARELHEDYTTTESYRALFHAALLLSECDTVDRIVTGLPVSQYLNQDIRQRLKTQMKGDHQVTQKRTVSVRDVVVVPQPVGGFIDHVWDSQEKIYDDIRVLVVDPGFFSVDWVLIRDGELRKQSSGTSLEASSVILDEAARLIADDHGSNVGRERIEHAIRRGLTAVRVLGKPVEVAPYLSTASERVAPIVVTRLKESLRKESVGADEILLVGGGARFFEKAIKDAFAPIPIHIPGDPVFSNARGFWRMGAE